MKSKLALKTILIVFMIFFANKTFSQWSHNPNVDNSLGVSNLLQSFSFCSDGHGGAIYTWNAPNGSNLNVYANRIDSLGIVRWGANGILVNANPQNIYYGPSNICEDGHRGCYIAYTDPNIAGKPLICQRFDSSGNALWSGSGLQAVSNYTGQVYQVNPWLVNDNGKGCFIVFTNAATNGGITAQLLDKNGNRKWGDFGSSVILAADVRTPKAISDGHNGIAVIWTDYDPNHFQQLLMNRLNHSGQERFTAGNKQMNQTGQVGYGCNYRLILSKKKNLIAVWSPDNGVSVLTQKLDSLGNFLWGATEINLSSGSGCPDVYSDGKDGAYYTWIHPNVTYRLYAQHLNKSGVKQWTTSGIQVDSTSASMSTYFAPAANGQFKIIFFDNTNSENRIVMQRLNSNGSLQLPYPGVAIMASGSSLLFNTSVLPAGNFNTIVFNHTVTGSYYAKYISQTGLRLEEQNVTSMPEFSFVVSPNPMSTSAFCKWQLTGDEAVYEISLYDLAGRKILSQKIFDGENTATLDVSELHQGIYLLNLEGVNFRATRKISVVH